MKITLISTSTFPSDQGIRTISAVLKKAGHKVNIIFMCLSENYSVNYSKSELFQLAKFCKNSDLIGINSYASTAHRASRIIAFLKKKFNIPIVYGGIHATISPEDCIKYSDIVCVGEGEEAILDLVNAIKNNKSILKIKNLWVKKREGIVKNQVRSVIENLDSLPFVDYDIQDHYILENNHLRRFREEDFSGQIFFLTGRGCPYGCTYCSNNFLNELYKGKCKKILRWYSAEYIIDCILELKKRFKTLNYFDIRDDSFSLRSIEQIKEFCEKYKERINMRFKCLADPKTISEEKIKLLIDAGCTDIIIGIQGSERVNREIYKRNQTDADVLRTSTILNKYRDKLTVMYDVITCNPYERSEDILNLIGLLRKIPKPYFLSVNNLVFFPGTELYEKARKNPLLKKQMELSFKLNYWDRAKHLKLKTRNLYLNLILNLMRGSVTEKRFGPIHNFILDYLLKQKKVKRNLENAQFSYLILFFVEIYDKIRENILKMIYRSMPVKFKIWYDKIRYKI